MFNNIIYFIIVLLIFNISYPEKTGDESFAYILMMLMITWIVFAAYCRFGFQRLLHRFEKGSDSGLTNAYQSLVLRLSILAILLFSLNVYMFHLKYWLQTIPGIDRFSVLQGILSLSLFLFYLATMWYFAHPVYRTAFHVNIKRNAFIISNIRFNVPILFPWLILTAIYDLLALTSWGGPENFLGRIEGQMIFFAVFLGILMIFIPSIIQYWWGCKPFDSSDRIEELKMFLNGMGFRYRALLKWPIFEGRIMTAGIMGVIPRYRYILMTDALMEILTVPELKAVMAHEVGHSRYRHVLYYMVFFLGYMILSFGSTDIFFNLLALNPTFIGILGDGKEQSASIFYIVLSLPILLTMFIYFRYIMGFFMRNFERQADLFSAKVMGSPAPAINALEKIAFLSGKSRNLPSWHHFSIKERVDCLWRILKRPELIKRHNNFVRNSLIIYLICIAGIGYLLNFSPLKQGINNRLFIHLLNRQVMENPNNSLSLQNLAMIYSQMGRYREAIDTYEKLLNIDASSAVALNNLAWLLITSPEKALRDERRALVLAEKAVSIEKIPTFLDTLAEAYYANGSVDKAIEIIKEAILLEKKDNAYYKRQLRKYMQQSEIQ